MLEAVSNRAETDSRRRRKHLGRVMNSVLLLLIFYGATCGLIHTHSGVRLTSSTFGTALGEARETDSTLQLLRSGKDCLLCQFHQQLSHGLLHAPAFASRLPAVLVSPLATTLDNYHAPHKSARGRAPPLPSLL